MGVPELEKRFETLERKFQAMSSELGTFLMKVNELISVVSDGNARLREIALGADNSPADKQLILDHTTRVQTAIDGVKSAIADTMHA